MWAYFSFFFFFFALLANFLSAFTQQLYLGFMRMKWAQLLSGSFFFFICFSSISIAKQRNLLSLHWWGSCSGVCAEAGLKESLFIFAPKLLSLGARLWPRWKKMRPEKWRPGKARKSLRLAQKRFFEPCFWTFKEVAEIPQSYRQGLCGEKLSNFQRLAENTEVINCSWQKRTKFKCAESFKFQSLTAPLLLLVPGWSRILHSCEE